MWTLFIILGLMPALIFFELVAQGRLFKKNAEKIDAEWELYRQTYD